MKLGKLQLICDHVKGRVLFDLGYVQSYMCTSAYIK